MTLIAGYIYQNTVHIIADSAESKRHLKYSKGHSSSGDFKTSFNEAEVTGDGFKVDDEVQKIYNIKNRMLLTFAGNATQGNNTVNDILADLNENESISEQLRYFFALNQPANVQIIGGFYENDQPHLFCYYPNEGFKMGNQEPVIYLAGANANNIGYIIPQGYEHAAKNQYSPHEVLILNLTSLQATAINFLTFSKGVGGYFNGALISGNGIEWAKDTFYLLYSALNFNEVDKFNVFKYNRDDATFILTKDLQRIFFSDICQNAVQIKQNWANQIRELAEKSLAEYYVFISYDTKAMVVINNEKEPRISLKNNNINIPHQISEWMGQYHHEHFVSRNNFKP